MLRDKRWMVGALAAAMWVAPAAAQSGRTETPSSAAQTNSGTTPSTGSNPTANGVDSTRNNTDPSRASSATAAPATRDPSTAGTGSGSAGMGSTSAGTGSADKVPENQEVRNPGNYAQPSSNGVDSTHHKTDPSTAPSSATRAGTGSAAGDTAGASAGGASAKTAQGSADTAQTLAKLHEGNQAEIQAGRWMQQHAQNSKVKEFAKKMVDDHGKMDKDVTSFARKQGVDLTNAATGLADEKAHHQSALEDLKGMSGARADRAYIDMMVEDHEKDVSDTRAAQQQAKSASEDELASLLDKSAKKMEGHLKDAQKIQRDLTQRQARTPGESR